MLDFNGHPVTTGRWEMEETNFSLPRFKTVMYSVHVWETLMLLRYSTYMYNVHVGS